MSSNDWQASLANMDPATRKTLIIIAMLHEVPDRNAAIAAAVLYGLITLVVLGLTIKTRSWFMMCVVVTGFMEVAGWSFRLNILEDPTLIWLVMMQAFLIIPPVLLAIVDYVCVAKLVNSSEAGRGTPFAKGLTWLFTGSDVLCLVLQGAGGAMYSNPTPSNLKVGRDLLLSGLFIQLAFFTGFIGVCMYVQRSSKYGFRGQQRLRGLWFCLYATIFLMYLRNVFRVIEFIQGYDGYLATHERFLYGFDFAPLYACFILFSVFHYGFYLGPQAQQAQLPATGAEASAVAAATLDKQASKKRLAAALPSVEVEAVGGPAA
jgi:hypothetical protein